MTLAERFIEYRVKHRITQKALAALLDEKAGTIFRIEANYNKPHRYNEIRLERKMTALEKQDETV